VKPADAEILHEAVRDFYDELAADYHLMFESWEDSMTRQSAVLAPILERTCGPAADVTLLDCACGIGTQALGLAKLGFGIVGSDISAKAIKRARFEAATRGVSAVFHVADMRELDRIPETDFDAVICMDNALPHLFSMDDIGAVALQAQAKLKNGGVFLASIRDYDRLVMEPRMERPSLQGPAFFRDGDRRRIVFQLWDWEGSEADDERRYTFHLYITRETPSGWTTYHGASKYRALLREELTNALHRAGFIDVRWLFPQETGFYQPIVVAKGGHEKRSRKDRAMGVDTSFTELRNPGYRSEQ
jgi:glycine/sarcosine N-methyltransferase